MLIASPRRWVVLRPSRLSSALGAERLGMSRFATFATLYTMALYLEPAEHWVYPVFTGALLALAGVLLLVGFTPRTLPILLVMATVAGRISASRFFKTWSSFTSPILSAPWGWPG